MKRPSAGPSAEGVTGLVVPLGCSRDRAQRFRGSGSEQGYVLQIALVAFLLLLIGSVALATRTYSGFFGAIFQASNREARDVAESAITDFQNTLNREENRYLLVQGTGTTWLTTAINNCTATLNARNEPVAGTATAVAQSTIDRFSPGSSFQKLDSSAASTRKQFRVESIEYRDASRNSYTTPPESLLSGASRGLIRVTILGRVTRNGVVSTSRVTREFEVVPKCCKRSFGKNIYGGVNWGRDSRSCIYKVNATGSGNGIIGALSGGAMAGSSNSIAIKNEDGNSVTQAICYAGIPSPSAGTELTSSVNASCAAGAVSIGTTSFNPLKFDLTLPDYCTLDAAYACAEVGRADADGLVDLTSGGNDQYIYFDSGTQSVRLCKATMSNGSNPVLQSIGSCTNLRGTSVAADDPCHYELMGSASTAALPYHTANCRVDHFKLGNGTVFIDTTAAKINLYIDADSQYISTAGGGRTSTAATTASNEYMEGGGNTTYKHVHCYGSYRGGSASSVTLAGLPVTTYTAGVTPCKQEPAANKTSGGYFQACSAILTGCPQDWDLAELLNVYTMGPGRFTINGTSSTVGFNLYAPRAIVEIKGGGNANPNFMGRIWTDAITLTGNAKITTLSTNPSFCGSNQCPAAVGSSLFDFIARSFSHASGY